MKDLAGKIITYYGGIRNHDARESKRRPYLVVADAEATVFGATPGSLIVSPTTTNPIALFDYLSLKNRLKPISDEVLEWLAVDKLIRQYNKNNPGNMQKEIDRVAAEISKRASADTSAEFKSEAVSEMDALFRQANFPQLQSEDLKYTSFSREEINFVKSYLKKNHENMYAMRNICIALPPKVRGRVEFPNIITELEPDETGKPYGLTQLRCELLRKFRFNSFGNFNAPRHGVLSDGIPSGSITYFNYSAFNIESNRSHLWLGMAYVVGNGEQFGYGNNSILIAPIDYTPQKADLPDIGRVMRIMSSDLVKKPMYVQLDKMMLVQRTCRFFYNRVVAHVGKDAEDQITAALTPEVFADTEKFRAFDYAGNLLKSIRNPYRSDVPRQTPTNNLDC